MLKPNQNLILAVVIAPVPFFLTSYSLYTQVMLILNFINVEPLHDI